MRVHFLRAGGCLILITLALTAAACGNNPSSEPTATVTTTLPTVATTSPSGTMNAEVCAEMAKLRTDLDDLKNINVVQSGTDAVKSKLTDIQNDLDSIKASTGSAPDVVAFQTALQALQTAVANLGGGTPSAGLTEVATAAAGAVVAGSTVLNRLQAGCPS